MTHEFDAPVLLDVAVLPLHAQVCAIDSVWRDYPVSPLEHPTRFVAVDRCTVVAGTISDADGYVRLLVADGRRLGTEGEGFTEWWDGSIEIPSGVMQVGNVEANDLRTISVPSGSHRVRVLVRPDRPDPDEVLFVLDGDDGPAV